MNISLTEDDLSQMPSALRTSLLHWISANQQTSVCRHHSNTKKAVKQLSLLPKPENQVPELETSHPRVTLTQLYDAGITKQGMPIRVRLKRDRAKELGRSYVNSLEIASTGKIFFQGHKFNIPSRLATKVNGSSANGWYYVEVKVDEHWVRLEQLRKYL